MYVGLQVQVPAFVHVPCPLQTFGHNAPYTIATPIANTSRYFIFYINYDETNQTFLGFYFQSIFIHPNQFLFFMKDYKEKKKVKLTQAQIKTEQENLEKEKQCFQTIFNMIDLNKKGMILKVI